MRINPNTLILICYRNDLSPYRHVYMEINCFPFIYSKSLYVFIDNDMISCIKVDSLCGKYIFDKTKNLSALITN